MISGRGFGKYIGKFLDILWPCGTEHEGLTIRANLTNDLSNLGLETHIEHTISFVHDEIGHSAKICFVSLKHIDETTGGGNHNLDATLQIADLGALGRTTVDGGVPDARVGAEL